VEIPVIPRIPGIASIPNVPGSLFRGKSQRFLKSVGSQVSLMLMEARPSGNPSKLLSPCDRKHPRCCWKLVQVEIPAILYIPRIPSIPDVSGSRFRRKLQQFLKSLGSQASLMLLEARSGGNCSSPSSEKS
jgi:hypothetical protein